MKTPSHETMKLKQMYSDGIRNDETRAAHAEYQRYLRSKNPKPSYAALVLENKALKAKIKELGGAL